MTGEKLIENVVRTVQDPSIDEDRILELLIEGHRVIAGETLLPDLQDSGAVDTILNTPYSAGLPADFSHELFQCVEEDPTNPIKVVGSLGVLFAKYGVLNRVGTVRHVALVAGTLAYQPIPAEVRSLTIHYYRHPVDLTESTEPEAIPLHLHKLLGHYACWQLFSDIEDGIEGAQVNTKKHENNFWKDLDSLKIFTKEGRSRRTPPVVKGDFL